MESERFGIRKEIEEERKLAVKYSKMEQGQSYPGLVGWAVYDSPVTFFDNALALPEGYNKISEYIDGEYKEGVGNLIGIELGGPGSKLFRDLNSDKRRFAKSVGVTLVDLRRDFLKLADKENSHEILEANVFSSSFVDDDGVERPGFKKIQDWVDRNGRADFVFELMHKPIHDLKKSSKLFLNLVLRWYRLLNEEGTLLVQGPEFSKEFLEQIKTKLSELNIRPYYKIGFDGLCYFTLKRLHGSPDDLNKWLR